MSPCFNPLLPVLHKKNKSGKDLTGADIMWLVSFTSFLF